jgi:phenylacetic acid degradation operon negative regulatory protein
MSEPKAPSTEDDVDLPRQMSGRQPQSLLITLLSDYWLERSEHVPSAFLVRMLEEFDITPASTRAALSRLARRRLLNYSKQGRRTYYGLSARAAGVLISDVPHILGFGDPEKYADWNGDWTFFAYSIPENQRKLRAALRARLRWAGFAPLYDGLWISPTGTAEQLGAVADELGIDAWTPIVGTIPDVSSTLLDPVAAWDLDDLRTEYEQFIDRFSEVQERARCGEVGSSEALVIRTDLMDAWCRFPPLDPDLPTKLLPDDWPRAQARSLFVDLYDQLGPLAEFRVKQMLSEYAPALAKLAVHHTSDYGPQKVPGSA